LNYSSGKVSLVLPSFHQKGASLIQALRDQVDASFLQSARRNKVEYLGDALIYYLLADAPLTSPPYASLTALGHGLMGDSGYWLRADPAEFLVDAANVYLIGRDHLALSQDETNQLLMTINALIAEDSLKLVAGSNHEWFLNLTSDPHVETVPFCRVIANDIRPYLPKGTRAKVWCKLLTEFQMLLFQHPLNSQREANGLPLINGIWLWGEGQLKDMTLNKKFNHIWSDHALVKGMLQVTDQCARLSMPGQFNIEQTQAGDYLLVLPSYPGNINLLITLIADLLTALLGKRLTELSLYLGNGEVYYWRAPRFINKIWSLFR